jgi:hypothetical protein
MALVALTSLSPNPAAAERQQACVQSWRAAGLDVVSINHPSEWPGLTSYGVELEAPSRTAVAEFVRHYVPINALLEWITAHERPALIVNADVELRVTPAQLEHLAQLAERGLPYVKRINHDAGDQNATLEDCGIDVMLVHPRLCNLYAESFLSLGQPWWDYWLPYLAARAGVPLYCPAAPLAFHLRHAGQWKVEAWDRCAVEFGRLVGRDAGADRAAHSRLSTHAYAEIMAHTTDGE